MQSARQSPGSQPLTYTSSSKYIISPPVSAIATCSALAQALRILSLVWGSAGPLERLGITKMTILAVMIIIMILIVQLPVLSIRSLVVLRYLLQFRFRLPAHV